MRDFVAETEEAIRALEEIRDNINDDISKILQKNNSEVYKRLIEVTKKNPELESIIEFIMFFEDKISTENELFRQYMVELIKDILDLKIKTLKASIEYVKRGEKPKDKKSVKLPMFVTYFLELLAKNKVVAVVLSFILFVIVVHFFRDDFLLLVKHLKLLLAFSQYGK